MTEQADSTQAIIVDDEAMLEAVTDLVEEDLEASEDLDTAEDDTYNPYQDLTQRHSGVQCPNPNCNDRIFSYDAKLSTSCRCGLTWVTGGLQYLKYGTGAPLQHEDVHIISQRLDTSLQKIQETEQQPVEVPNALDGIQEEVGVGIMPEEVAETEAVSIVDELPTGDDLPGPEQRNEVVSELAAEAQKLNLGY